MPRLRQKLTSTIERSVMALSRCTGLDRVIRPLYGGSGAILLLHRVVPRERQSRLAANRRLEITPEYLEQVIVQLRRAGYQAISMDRLASGFERRDWPRPFICFSIDDGYADTLEYALPVFEAYQTPFIVYIATGYIDGTILPWHLVLEALVVASNPPLPTAHARRAEAIIDRSENRAALFHDLNRKILSLSPRAQYAFADTLAQESDRSLTAFRHLMLDWQGVKALARHPLVTIGAHTVNHPPLSQLATAGQVQQEMLGGKRRLEEKLGQTIEHFAYPFGTRHTIGERERRIARQCGFSTMTTTREGTIHPRHHTHRDSLPRIEIAGGNEASLKQLMLQLCGVRAMLYNRFVPVVTG